MHLNTATVQGTLKADGTLELDEKPELAPGRVQVTILPIPASSAAHTQRTLLDVLDEIRANQQARGYRGRSSEELAADEAERRSEDQAYEDRWRSLWHQTSSTHPADGTTE
jgi:hypothetical protein